MPGSQGVLIPRRLAGRPQATFSHAPGPSPHLPVAQARRLRWSPNSRSLSFSSSHLLFSLTSCLFLSHSSLVIQSFIIERHCYHGMTPSSLPGSLAAPFLGARRERDTTRNERPIRLGSTQNVSGGS